MTKKIHNTANKLQIALLLFGFILCANQQAFAQGPVQPEAMQFEPVDVTDVVNLATGDFVYTIPLLNVPGPEGDYPVVLSYHSGIGPNQPATWVGLGWTLNPGAVNRILNGYPDDFNGDIVRTVYQSQGKKHHGVSLGAGWGPYGINMDYNTYSGFSANAFAGIDIGKTGSLKIQGGTDGFSTSAGYKNLGIGISGGESGITTFANVETVIGSFGVTGNRRNQAYTFSSNGASVTSSKNGSSFNYSGTGFQTSGSPSKGFVNSFSMGIPIVLPSGHWFSVGYSQSQWMLFDVNEEPSYGALNQNSYNNERYVSGDYIYPSKDNFLVSGQGISGTFNVMYDNAYVLKDHDEHHKKGYLNSEFNENGESLDFSDNHTPIFRFLGDQGGNHSVNHLDTNWGEDIWTFDDEAYSTGKKIEPIYESGKFSGFIVTNYDGMVYEFKIPSLNFFQYSETIIDEESILTNLNSLNGNFATSWVLTAIKGPDYIDRGDEGLSDEDWGYWIKLEYEYAELPQVWRSPYSGYAPGTDEKVESFNLGLRQSLYLKSIESKTHLAEFNTVSEDTNHANPDFSTNLLHNPTSLLIPNINGGKFVFQGNYEWLDDLDNSTIIIEALNKVRDCYYSAVYGDHDDNSSTPDELLYYEKYCGASRANDIENITIGSGDLKHEANHSYVNIFLDGASNEFCIDLPDRVNYFHASVTCHEYSVATLFLSNLISSDDHTTRKLDFVTLINKQNSSEILKKIDFEFDYSLRPNSNGSIAEGSSGAWGGSLTLNSIYFEGRNGKVLSPPYRFEYANGDTPGNGLNPNYHKNDWDNWGSYRDPRYDENGSALNRGFRVHDTPQEKGRADLAAAWSLTKIETPTGATTQIEYESDNYYLIEKDAFDLKHGTDFTNEVVSTNSYELEISMEFINSFKIGEFLFLIEKKEACERSVEVHIGESYYDPHDGEWKTALTPMYGDEICYESVLGFDQSFKVEEITSTRELVLSHNPLPLKKPDSPYSYNPSNDTEYQYSYDYFWLKGDNTFGGGIRVSSITTIDGGFKNSTKYTYKDGEFSSGAVATLPTPIGLKHPFVGAPKKFLSTFLDDDLAYGRPSPGVLYSKVQVQNISETNSKLNGFTEFEFYTAKDHQYSVTKSGEELTIKDYSGIYGKPKSTTYYEEFDSGFRPVRKSVFNYAFSDQLNDSAKVIYDGANDWDEVTNPENKLLGVTQQKHISFHEITNGNWKTTKVDRINMNVYDVGQTSTEYFYPDDQSTTPSSTITTKARTIGYDMYTGQPLVTVSQTSEEDELLISRKTPAWWKYPEMGDRNMLTQGYENTTFKSTDPNISDIDDIEDLKDYDFLNSYSDVIASEITTWSNHWSGVTNDFIWRKNDSYSYISSETYTPLLSNSDTTHSWKFPETGIPWQMTSNVIRYDNFGHVTESVSADGTYQSVLYDQDNHSLVKAVAIKARLSEIEIVDYEESTYNQTGARTGEHYGANLDGIIATAPSGSPQSGGGYQAGIWYRTPLDDSPITLNGKSFEGTQPDEWKFARLKLNPGQNIVSNDVADFDDITIVPEYGSISYFSYDPLTWKVTAMTGPDHRTTFYEYDDAGRLILTRDFEGNIMTKNSYGYANEVYVTQSPSNPDPLQQVTFTAHKLDPSLNITNYDWAFGDGEGFESTSSNTATHTFQEKNTYQLVLTTEDEKGNSRRHIKDIEIGNDIEITISDDTQCFDSEGNGNINDFVCNTTLTATVSNEVLPASYKWYESNDNGNSWNQPEIGTGKTISFTEQNPGVKHLKFEVIDNTGSKKEKVHVVYMGVQ